GKALLTFRQETPGEHVDPNEVLKALGIEGKVEVEDHGAAECGAEACAMPSRPKKK
ncbi:prostamide/prostaglandin F synthase, partial [Biomphalaria glabrata]